MVSLDISHTTTRWSWLLLISQSGSHRDHTIRNQEVSLRTLTSGGLPLRGGALRAWQGSGLSGCFVYICLG
jgi:hypothetical protein